VLVQLPSGTTVEGEAEGVDDSGRLLVNDIRGHQHALAAGDVVRVR
jgi:BirA family transcriptional regulator, biotin operon repressor / biotin---[acetyl-CoA-carboxylase] ligase